MDVLKPVVLGFIVGVVGSLPPLLLLERTLRGKSSASVAAGMVSIAISFAMLSVAVFVVWKLAPQYVLYFGVAEIASFLLIWAIEAWRSTR